MGKLLGLYRSLPQSDPCLGVSITMNNQRDKLERDKGAWKLDKLEIHANRNYAFLNESEPLLHPLNIGIIRNKKCT